METKNRFSHTICGWLLVLFFILAFIQPCFAKKAPYVPEQLKPWVDWVLHDKEEQLECIPQYNNANIYQCNWPSKLEISLNNQGGEFSQSWLVHSESWVELPGKSGQWPHNLQVDGKTQIVLQQVQQ